MSYILTIDPGNTGTGLAFWEANRWHEVNPPMSVAQVFPSSRVKGNWIACGRHILVQISNMIEQVGMPAKVICEYQEFFESSARGRTATQRGDITKLTILTGRMMQFFEERGVEFDLVKPSEWRGQMHDDALMQRVIDRLGERACRELGIKGHIVDAVGIGLWSKGVLTLNGKR